MSSLPLKLLALVLVSAFALASPADAKTRKHKNTAVTSETAYGPHYWGRTWFVAVRSTSAVCISATTLIRTSAFRSCAISAVVSAATPTDDSAAVFAKALFPFDFFCLIG